MNNSFEDRLIIDSRSTEETVLRVLDEVRQLRSDSFVARILQNQDIDTIRNWENTLTERCRQPFSLVVMGDFKRGKSSLINAILGKEVTVTDATPETVTINRIRYGEDDRIEAVLTTGARVHLEQSELPRQVFEKVMKDFPAPVDYVDISANCEILRDICIVDTPGLSDPECFDEKVKDHVTKADAVLYVVSALSPLSEAEQKFLATILSPQDFSRLFVVVNFADCLDDTNEISRVIDLVLERTRAVLPSSVVFPVSALSEFNRKTGRKAPNPALANYLNASFDRFEATLQSDMLMHKDIIKAGRIKKQLKMMLANIRNKVTALCELLTGQVDDLAEKEQQCNEKLLTVKKNLAETRQKLNQLTDQLYADTEKWMTGFIARLQKELETQGQQSYSVLQKHMMFYITDMISEASICCLENSRKAVEEEIQKLLGELDGVKLLSAFPGTVDVSMNNYCCDWNLGDGLAAYNNYIFSEIDNDFFSELLQAGMNFLGGLWRECTHKKDAGKMVTDILAHFPEIEKSCLEQLRSIYDTLSEQAAKQIETIYKACIQRAIDDLAQAQAILKESSVKQEEIKEKLAFAAQILDRADQIVKETEIRNNIQ